MLNRMLTYAKGIPLNKEQFDRRETKEPLSQKEEFIKAFKTLVSEALAYYITLETEAPLVNRGVDKKQLPSTVMGLLFHLAEHVQRHLGALLVIDSVWKATKF